MLEMEGAGLASAALLAVPGVGTALVPLPGTGAALVPMLGAGATPMPVPGAGIALVLVMMQTSSFERWQVLR